jgi:hypothetical protein
MASGPFRVRNVLHDSSMNYGECRAYLHGLGVELYGVKFGLEAITNMLANLESPHLKYPTAIVAGTNGRGPPQRFLPVSCTMRVSGRVYALLPTSSGSMSESG